MIERICISCDWLKYMIREDEEGYYFTCGCYESTRYELPVDPEDTCDCFREGSEEKISKRKFAESKPFSSGTEYEIFKDNWCYECEHYKEREDDGFPEFPENGGCRILDYMERARFGIRYWPNKKIIEEHDADGNVLYWHKCISFKRRKTDD